MVEQVRLTVLFADVSGSTRLYETLGDVRARAIVARCLAAMTEATERHGGHVIKTIGDEVMSTFPSPGQAADAAVAMQEAITGAMEVEGRPIAIRIGFHCGPTLLEHDDVFGDAVNVAARMASQAKPAEIVTTGETAAELPPRLAANCREIEQTHVKGKAAAIALTELVWQSAEATIMRKPWANPARAGGHLTLSAPDSAAVTVDDTHPAVTLGRAEQNDLVVARPLTSRLHARVEYRNGRFSLTDLSANGTWLAATGREAVFVHRDSAELTGSGRIGLGTQVEDGAEAVVGYEIW